MTTQNRIRTVLALAAAAVAVVAASAGAATMSASATAPAIDSTDIANYGTVTGTDKWWSEAKTSGRPKGQTFTTGDTDVLHSLFSIATDNVGNAEAIKSAGEVTVDVEKEDVPLTFALHPGYPNPFNPVAMLPFDIARTASVEIRVYDVLGRLVRKAALGELPPGRYQQQLNLAGSASGVYVYEIRVTEQSRLVFRKARKIILIK